MLHTDQLVQMKDMLDSLTKEVDRQGQQLTALGALVSSVMSSFSAIASQLPPPQQQPAASMQQVWFGASQMFTSPTPAGPLGVASNTVWQQQQPFQQQAAVDVGPASASSHVPQLTTATVLPPVGMSALAATLPLTASAASSSAPWEPAAGNHGAQQPSHSLRSIIRRSASARPYVVRSARATAGRVIAIKQSSSTSTSHASVTAAPLRADVCSALQQPRPTQQSPPSAAPVGTAVRSQAPAPATKVPQQPEPQPQPSSAASPSVVVSVICGVSKASASGSRGFFNLQQYKAAASGRREKLPACLELTAIKRDGQWMDVNPRRQLTPLEFAAEAGLKSKNWKASIRHFANDAVGQPLGDLLDSLVDRGVM